MGKTYAQELIQNDMLRWLKANAEKPFFLFYAITLPHARHEIDDFGIYKDKSWSEREKAYAAQVTRVDSDVGKLSLCHFLRDGFQMTKPRHADQRGPRPGPPGNHH